MMAEANSAGGMAPRTSGSVRVGGVFEEPRDPRMHVEARIPFSVAGPDLVEPLEGVALSVAGFRARATVGGAAAMPAKGARIDACLRIETSGMAVEIPVSARASGISPNGEIDFERLDAGPQADEALRRLVRAWLAGRVARPDELLGPADAPTRDLLARPRQSPD